MFFQDLKKNIKKNQNNKKDVKFRRKHLLHDIYIGYLLNCLSF